MWLGSAFLEAAGLQDDLAGHFELAEKLGQDLVCLSISEEAGFNQALSYRYFKPDDLNRAAGLSDRFLMAVIDGPFQRLIEKHGLMKILSGWMREKDRILELVRKERVGFRKLLDQVLQTPVDGIVMAEDLAGEQGPLISPADIETHFATAYTQAVAAIHQANRYALVHCCGKIDRLLPLFISCGFDGLAAIQGQANDLTALKAAHGDALTIMAGIEADLLTSETPSDASLAQYKKQLHSLSQKGGFILSSATGLYAGDFYPKIKTLYKIADQL